MLFNTKEKLWHKHHDKRKSNGDTCQIKISCNWQYSQLTCITKPSGKCQNTSREQGMCIMVCTNSAGASLVCTNCTRAFWFVRAHVFFPHISHVSLACTLAWHIRTQVIRSKPNTCVCTYYYTKESIPFRGNVNSVTLTNKLTVGYGDIQMTTCILTL